MERNENWNMTAINLISAVIKLREMGETLEKILECVRIAYTPPTDLSINGLHEIFIKFAQNVLDVLEEDGCEVPKIEDCFDNE